MGLLTGVPPAYALRPTIEEAVESGLEEALKPDAHRAAEEADDNPMQARINAIDAAIVEGTAKRSDVMKVLLACWEQMALPDINPKSFQAYWDAATAAYPEGADAKGLWLEVLETFDELELRLQERKSDDPIAQRALMGFFWYAARRVESWDERKVMAAIRAAVEHRPRLSLGLNAVTSKKQKAQGGEVAANLAGAYKAAGRRKTVPILKHLAEELNDGFIWGKIIAAARERFPESFAEYDRLTQADDSAADPGKASQTATGLEEQQPEPVDPGAVLPGRAEGEAAALARLNDRTPPITPMVLIFGDVDWLGLLNKLYSKRIVNPVLAEIFIILKREVEKRGGIIYRHGGDEFACLVPLSDVVADEADLTTEAHAMLEEILQSVAEAFQNRYIVIQNFAKGERSHLPAEYWPRRRAEEQYAGRTLYLLEVPEEEREDPLAILPDLQAKAAEQGLGKPQPLRIEGNNGVFGLLHKGEREKPKQFPVTVSLGAQVISRLDKDALNLEQYERLRFNADDWLAEAKTATRWKNAVAVGDGLKVNTHVHGGKSLLTVSPQISGDAVLLQNFPPEQVREQVYDDFEAGYSSVTVEIRPGYRWASGAQQRHRDEHGNMRLKGLNDKSYKAGDNMIMLLLAVAHDAFKGFSFEDQQLEVTVSRAPPAISADVIRVHLRWPHRKGEGKPLPAPDEKLAWIRLREAIEQRVERARAQANQYLDSYVTDAFAPFGIRVHLDWAGVVSDLERDDAGAARHFQRLDAALMVTQDLRSSQKNPPERVGFLHHPKLAEGQEYGFLFDPIETGVTGDQIDAARVRLERGFLNRAKAEARLVLGITGTQREPAYRLDAPHAAPAAPSTHPFLLGLSGSAPTAGQEETDEGPEVIAPKPMETIGAAVAGDLLKAIRRYPMETMRFHLLEGRQVVEAEGADLIPEEHPGKKLRELFVRAYGNDYRARPGGGLREYRAKIFPLGHPPYPAEVDSAAWRNARKLMEIRPSPSGLEEGRISRMSRRDLLKAAGAALAGNYVRTPDMELVEASVQLERIPEDESADGGEREDGAGLEEANDATPLFQRRSAYALEKAREELWTLLLHAKRIHLPRGGATPADQWERSLMGFSEWAGDDKDVTAELEVDPQKQYVRLEYQEASPSGAEKHPPKLQARMGQTPLPGFAHNHGLACI